MTTSYSDQSRLFRGVEITANTTRVSDQSELFRGVEITANTTRVIAARQAQTRAQVAALEAQKARLQKSSAALRSGTSTNPLATPAQAASNKLKDRLKSTTGGATGGVSERLDRLASVELADTLISTGPKDELLTVDVLGVSDANILSSLSNKLSGFDTSPLESFRASSSRNSSFETMQLDSFTTRRIDPSRGGTSLFSSNLNGGFSINPSQMADRILSSITGGQGLIRGLSGPLQDSILGGGGIGSLGSMAASSVLSSMGVDIGGQLNSFNNNNFSDARGIFDLVNRVSGQPGLARYVDTGAESSLLSGVFRECMRVGVPMAIEALIGNDRFDPRSVDYALRSNMVDAVNYSDLSTIARIIERVGPNQILADTPNAVQQLLANYRFPVGTTYSQYGARWTELQTVLNSIEPNWGRYNRNGVMVDDLSFYTRISPDARTLLMSVPSRREAVMIAASYPTVVLRNLAKSMYPLAVI